jgi:hypothetical protein
MNSELLGILIVSIIYWYFNIRKQDYITIDLPLEKMANVSIFENKNLD